MLFPHRRRPLLLGHRGVREGVEENTLEAFRRALEAGLDGVELDVQRTADGALVIHHDFLAGGLMVHTSKLSELKRRLPRLPLLEEVLELLEAFPDALLNLELKSIPGFYDGRAEALARAVSSWPGRERAWISSFDPVALLRVRETAPELPLGYLFIGHDSSRLAELLELEAVHPKLDLVTRDRVARWHRLGFSVITWPAATREEALAALGAGVDGVIGGWPDELLKAKEELGHAQVDEQPRDVGDGGYQGVGDKRGVHAQPGDGQRQ